uniref:Reverse transcriptase domain-containing protein n=1 Tax=Tanacetum cinerariifolium TaxID=118510 RepID=A0A6L2K2C0_TANCI|nr:reverse transcriptase domain-containing protein [Tanacetum cinerariifolium]
MVVGCGIIGPRDFVCSCRECQDVGEGCARFGAKTGKETINSVSCLKSYCAKFGEMAIKSVFVGQKYVYLDTYHTECASVTTSSVIPREERTCPANFTIALHPDFPDQEVVIGGSLSDKGRTELCSVLKKNLDIFAWQPSDMTGVSRSVAEHRLNIREGYSPVRPKKRGQAPERAKAIQAEVQKLVEARIMREVYYHDWLSNPVMVKKYNGSWRVCVDFTDLNKAYAYKGYHQIQLAEADEEKTAFHTGQGVYCYTKMPFGLKNAGATYQRLMEKAFEGQVGRNIEVYIDDLVVKSHTEAEMVRDIEETFHTLRKVNMKLNPKKCSFGLGEGVFLGRRLTSWASGKGVEFTYALRFQFAASNNEAEYEALVASLRIATQIGVKNVQVNVDSKLVANQVLGTYVAKEDNMMTQLVDYLKEGILPGDEKEARKLRLKARQYELVEGVLYRRSFLTPWLRCVGPLQANYGIDIAGPFLEGPGKVKFLIVAMDYFTKWIEAKAVATITDGQVKKFVWDNIVCRFGIPGEIISDNGKQFSDNPFKDWCDKLNITQRFASVKHPQSNGLVERANRSLREVIKSRLGEGNKNWVEELPHVLWAHRIMIKSSHGDTPFSLTYGTEAVIPTEIGMPTYRTAAVNVVNNDAELRLNLDLLEERRERAAVCEAKSKSKMMKYYNARVRGVTFRPGDFVYRSNDASYAVAGGKLGPKWEGPYEVTEALGNGAYKLRSTDGTILPRR